MIKNLMALFGMLVVIGAWICWWKNGMTFIHQTDLEKAGQFGDMFGVLTSLFSGLAFIGVLYTSLQQHEELNIAKSANNAEKITQEKQRFENTFFALLEQHNNLIQIITKKEVLSVGQKSVSGNITIDMGVKINPSFVQRALRELTEKDFNGKVNEINLKNIKSKLIAYYSPINQYFRVLYQILKFIESADNFPFEENGFSAEKKFYSNIVRSFLSEELYWLLAINCYCEKGNNDDFWKYKILIEKYSFLEHINLENTLLPVELSKEIVEYYADNAFGNTDYKIISNIINK